VDVQTAREEPDASKGLAKVLDEFEMALERDQPSIKRPVRAGLMRDPSTSVLKYLQMISREASRPLVLLIDEADGLVGEAMVSFLTQLRRGYIDRSRTPFPHALALVGMRQVRDYVVSSDERRAVSWLGTTSPFNITAESATLRMFTEDEVGELLQQHTDATGQRFEGEAIERIWYLSQGHPWLINALAAEVVHRDVMDRTVAVTAKHVETAKETIIVERRTHIDSLVARLREPRVMRIVAPMLVGDRTSGDVLNDDFAYVLGLGLIAQRGGQYEVANPIYREVIPRALNYDQQLQISEQSTWYILPDGGLDIRKLLSAWQEFWREDGHLAASGFGYREAGPHLMLMAFLQRIINSGGRIDREYGLGRGALDLMIEWKGVRHVIEIKLRRDERTEAQGLRQITRYLDSSGLQEGWLVLFDLRETVTWAERLYVRQAEHAGKTIHIVGC